MQDSCDWTKKTVPIKQSRVTASVSTAAHTFANKMLVYRSFYRVVLKFIGLNMQQNCHPSSDAIYE